MGQWVAPFVLATHRGRDDRFGSISAAEPCGRWRQVLINKRTVLRGVRVLRGVTLAGRLVSSETRPRPSRCPGAACDQRGRSRRFGARAAEPRAAMPRKPSLKPRRLDRLPMCGGTRSLRRRAPAGDPACEFIGFAAGLAYDRPVADGGRYEKRTGSS
jgi:hypothetical protein